MSRLVGLPILHVGGIDPTGPLWSDWNVEPTIVVGLLALVAGYLFLVRRRESAGDQHQPQPDQFGKGHTGAFIAGALVIFVALGPPLMIGRIITCS